MLTTREFLDAMGEERPKPPPPMLSDPFDEFIKTHNLQSTIIQELERTFRQAQADAVKEQCYTFEIPQYSGDEHYNEYMARLGVLYGFHASVFSTGTINFAVPAEGIKPRMMLQIPGQSGRLTTTVLQGVRLFQIRQLVKKHAMERQQLNEKQAAEVQAIEQHSNPFSLVERQPYEENCGSMLTTMECAMAKAEEGAMNQAEHTRSFSIPLPATPEWTKYAQRFGMSYGYDVCVCEDQLQFSVPEHHEKRVRVEEDHTI